MVFDLLTQITTTPVSAELKYLCLVILGLGTAEAVAEGVYTNITVGERYSFSAICV